MSKSSLLSMIPEKENGQRRGSTRVMQASRVSGPLLEPESPLDDKDSQGKLQLPNHGENFLQLPMPGSAQTRMGATRRGVTPWGRRGLNKRFHGEDLGLASDHGASLDLTVWGKMTRHGRPLVLGCRTGKTIGSAD